MKILSIIDGIGSAPEIAHVLSFALLSRDTLARWFEPSGLRASPVFEELITVLVFLFAFCILLVLSVAVLICIGVRRESRMGHWQAALWNTPLARVMLTDFRSLCATDSLGQAARAVLKSMQRDFPIVEGERVAGMLSRSQLFRSLELHGPEVPLAQVMRHFPSETNPDAPLWTALKMLRNSNEGVLGVVEAGHLLGLVTEDNVREYIQAEAVLRSQRMEASPSGRFPIPGRSEGIHHA